MKAVVYSKDNCQECDRIKNLLKNISISFLDYKLNEDFTKKQFILEFGENAQFPQIAIDCNHIGNLKETLQYLKNKELL